MTTTAKPKKKRRTMHATEHISAEIPAAICILAARKKPRAPSDGPDQRAGYLRSIWANRLRRPPSCSDEDYQRADQLVGEAAT